MKQEKRTKRNHRNDQDETAVNDQNKPLQQSRRADDEMPRTM